MEKIKASEKVLAMFDAERNLVEFFSGEATYCIKELENGLCQLRRKRYSDKQATWKWYLEAFFPNRELAVRYAFGIDGEAIRRLFNSKNNQQRQKVKLPEGPRAMPTHPKKEAQVSKPLEEYTLTVRMSESEMKTFDQALQTFRKVEGPEKTVADFILFLLKKAKSSSLTSIMLRK
ncbi:hypothetical protein V6R21_19215 [Limibacter armeniacum]|uniref:hypothetical protein n=1 Tax=Limibacter armeniacum TaxID=466084 RepID=UPI002FE5BBA2